MPEWWSSGSAPTTTRSSSTTTTSPAYIPQLIEHQDEPTSDWTAIPQHFVTKLARDTGTPVVQVGEGADEIFHGYKGYADHRRFVVPFQRRVPDWAQQPIGDAAVWLTQRLGRGIRHGEAIYDAAASPIPYWGGALCFRGPLKDRIVRNGAGRPDSRRIPEAVWREAEAERPDADLFQKMTYVELKQRLSELLLMRLDRITMASSVEGRDPFLDHRLVEFVVALPPTMKFREGNGKYVLKKAMRGTLPDEILDRRKQGFGTPMPEWLRGRFGELAERTIRRQRFASVGYSTWIRLSACSPPTEQVAETGATTCGISTASAHGTTGGSRGSPPDRRRRRRAATFARRLRWLDPAAGTSSTSSTIATRRRRPPHVVDDLDGSGQLTHKLVSCGTKNAPGRSRRESRACSPLTRSGTARTSPAAAGRSDARAGADPGGRERDQGGNRTLDRDRHRQHAGVRGGIRSALCPRASRRHQATDRR